MLGCILFELLTLKKPFEGNFFEIVRRIVNEPIKSIDNEGIDPSLLPIFQKLLTMLLNKCAPLRCSASELIELPELRERIHKFKRPRDDAQLLQDEEEKKAAEITRNHFSAYRDAIAKKQNMLRI
jgi:hypothetical protein